MMSNRLYGLPVDKGGLRAGNRTGTGVTSGFAALLHRLLRCNRGVEAIEFGLGAPMLLAVLVPVADLGIAFSTQQQLRQAVQAGAQYAAIHPWNQSSPSEIANAVTAATPLSGVTVSPAPYQLCGCPSSSSGNASTSITSSAGITTANPNHSSGLV
ncbi:MAG TPA: TadE/TadG family type IV pilus assembly protein [Stellaceae bacterium]|nr:TadE/TadG family type IV pilus assembly protein [Stellaceae bacterium]